LTRSFERLFRFQSSPERIQMDSGCMKFHEVTTRQITCCRLPKKQGSSFRARSLTSCDKSILGHLRRQCSFDFGHAEQMQVMLRHAEVDPRQFRSIASLSLVFVSSHLQSQPHRRTQASTPAVQLSVSKSLANPCRKR
jgi:hypothetical protein